METEDILGYQITTQNSDACIDDLYASIKNNREQTYFVCLNPHSMVVAEKDPLFKTAIVNANLAIPDGSGIILASRILGGKIRSRVTGSDIFRNLSKKLNDSGDTYSYFFLGARDKTLELITSKMATEYPNITIAGTLAPPYRVEFNNSEIDEMVEAINQTKPDVLWIGLSAPKQEKWIYRHRNKINVKLLCPVGAVFDYYTDIVKRPGQWYLSHGLEWLPRLLQEPRRLWRRMGVSAPIFLLRVFKQRVYKFFIYY